MKKSAKKELAELKAVVLDYVNKVRNRQNVIHSTTPSIKKVDGKDGAAVVAISELVSVAQVANAVNKMVRLTAESGGIVVNLVDAYPALPTEFSNVVYESSETYREQEAYRKQQAVRKVVGRARGKR